jgi:cytidylate kinase
VSPGTRRLVTVDGPASSGKTTLGRRLALLLEVQLVDTGLLYRAVTLAAARRGVAAGDEIGLSSLAEGLSIEVATDPEAEPALIIDGERMPAGELYDPRLAALLAAASATPGVRRALLAPQRALAEPRGGVFVGRDCGTVVFPDAPLKLYLDAAEEVRSERRARQLRLDGSGGDTALLTVEVGDRDRADSVRSAAPLRVAPDAHVIRTDRLGIEAMVEAARERCVVAGMLPA